MGIAVLSQLMICASQVNRDFRIDQINSEAIPLLKHPDSFRTSMVQILNEAYNAFMKAHINMEKIQLQVSQVPNYVKDCVKIMKSDHKVAKERFLPRRQENIEKIAANGHKLSKEVCDAFNLLKQLIQQVLLAILKSQKARENEIPAAIKDGIDDKLRRKEESIKRQIEKIEKEESDARKFISKGQEYIMEEHNRSRGFFERFFNPGEKREKIEGIKSTVEYAKERLKKAKQDAAEAEKKMEKNCDNWINSLKNMHIDVQKDISTDRMIQILKDGTKLLSDLQGNWTGMTLYFEFVNSYMEELKKKQQDFVKDSQDAQEDPLMIDFMMSSSMEILLESSIMSHRTAATYVKISNNYIMEPLRKMHGMLAIEPAKIKQAQLELVESCKRASEGIKVISKKDSEQTIRELENELQSPDPVQSIQN
jgi:hypothetical protein